MSRAAAMGCNPTDALQRITPDVPASARFVTAKRREDGRRAAAIQCLVTPATADGFRRGHAGLPRVVICGVVGMEFSQFALKSMNIGGGEFSSRSRREEALTKWSLVTGLRSDATPRQASSPTFHQPSHDVQHVQRPAALGDGGEIICATGRIVRNSKRDWSIH